jgi:hypothetical protein
LETPLVIGPLSHTPGLVLHRTRRRHPIDALSDWLWLWQIRLRQRQVLRAGKVRRTSKRRWKIWGLKIAWPKERLRLGPGFGVGVDDFHNNRAAFGPLLEII